MQYLMNFLALSVFFSCSLVHAQFSGLGSGTPKDPYQITTKEQLEEVNDCLYACYTLMNDLDMSSTPYTRAVIGYSGSFTGIFEGNSFVIRNLTINTSGSTAGLFGNVGYGGEISDIGVVDCNINSTSTSYNFSGGLVGRNGGDILNCYAVGSISGTSTSYIRVGGLVGENNRSLINCYSIADVSSSSSLTNHAGGLVGNNWTGTISQCYAMSNVHAIAGSDNSTVGGLVGLSNGLISNSYATGNAHFSGTLNNARVGGFLGENYFNEIINCYSTGAASSDSTSTRSTVGGLVGMSSDGVLNSFWNIETSGLTSSYGGSGKNSEQMKDIATFLAGGWSFISDNREDADWYMPLDSYPKLLWQSPFYYTGQTELVLNLNQIGSVHDLSFNVSSIAEQTLSWTITQDDTSCLWIKNLTPLTGSFTASNNSREFTIQIDTSGMEVGQYSENLLLSADDGSCVAIPVTLSIYQPVGMQEFALLADNWMKTGCNDQEQPCFQSDFFASTDGEINELDLFQLAVSWLEQDIVHIDESQIFDGFETADFSALDWHLEGNVDWFFDRGKKYDGSYTVRSGIISHYQRSALILNVDSTGFDTISFAHFVQSEPKDRLYFYIDGVQIANFYYQFSWQVVSYPIAEGTHTLKWEYATDTYSSYGANAAWLDNIRIYKAE
jgi:hypothetical protein